MIFFRNIEIELFSKFLWVGLIFGVVSIIFKTCAKIFRKNVYVVNILSFLFWIAFGGVYSILCFYLNWFSFSLVGLLAMILGVLIIRISVDFFFDYFIRFIYNEFSSLKRKRKNGKLQADKKIWKFR